VDPASQSWAAIAGWTAAFALIAFGLGLMSSNPTNIERPILVGAFSACGGLLFSFLLWQTQSIGGPFSWSQVFGYLLVGLAMFGWGMLIDYILGPAPVDREADEETLGAHLSD
jgi:hypothetical protein